MENMIIKPNDIQVNVYLSTPGYADGTYTVISNVCKEVSLYWADSKGQLDTWTSIAHLSIEKNGMKEFIFEGMRAIPAEATHVLAKGIRMDDKTEVYSMVEIPESIRSKPYRKNVGEIVPDIRVCAVSDIHISNNCERLRRALSMAENSETEIMLIAGDLVNDGITEQFSLVEKTIEDKCFHKPILTVSGNHDYPVKPLPQVKVKGEINDYYSLQNRMKIRANEYWEKRAEQGISIQEIKWEQDVYGGFAVKYGNITFIGLNVISHGRRFDLNKGKQIQWLKKYLKESTAKMHLIFAHTPLWNHNVHAARRNNPYIKGDKKLQEIIDEKGHVIFVSGHTHQSPNNKAGGVLFDRENFNIYIDVGSVCPTEIQQEDKEELISKGWKGGNFTEIFLGRNMVEISMKMLNGRNISRGYYRFLVEDGIL